MASNSFIDKNVVFKRLKAKSENKICFDCNAKREAVKIIRSRSFWGNDPVRVQGLKSDESCTPILLVVNKIYCALVLVL
uniref:Uncharacterized protein n=1 Tax=Cucumis melo TaxID=3656 RepID=A0A9I9E4K8_CUCME